MEKRTLINVLEIAGIITLLIYVLALFLAIAGLGTEWVDQAVRSATTFLRSIHLPSFDQILRIIAGIWLSLMLFNH